MANRDLLKEAIADAKAVKETAIANAKAALEESFAPMLREKLAAKLAEMDKMEEEEEIKEAEDMKEEELEETYNSMEEEKVEETEEKMEEEKVEEEMDLEELLRELDELEEEDSMEEAETTDETLYEEEKMEEEKVEEAEEMEMDSKEEEEIDLENIDEGDLKKFIEDVIADMVEAGELEGNIESEDEKEEEEGEEEMEMKVNEGEDEVEDVASAINAIMENKEEVNEVVMSTALGITGLIMAGMLLTGYATSLVDAKKKVKEFMAKNPNISKEEAKKLVSKDDKNAYGGQYTGGKSSAGAGTAFTEAKNEELEEAYNTIKTIKEELAEVNLFNAKLLYTNKIFKSKNLTESQKVKVLAAFDKAASVEEAKLVFETLSEGFTSKKTSVNESLIRGGASKPAGTAAKKPIMEANDQVTRWQKLAGIK